MECISNFYSFQTQDAVIRKKIEKILKTADLEKVTMKTVRQQVIDMYPDHDLNDKKEFIKSTVKEVRLLDVHGAGQCAC